MAIKERDTMKECILFLSYHLLNHQPFREELVKLSIDFPHMKRYPWEWLASPAVEKLRKHDYLEYEKIKEYQAQLEALAFSYNLKEEWALELLHKGVCNPAPAAMAPLEPQHGRTKKYTINWSDADLRSKKEIREDIIKQFEQQWAEHRQRAKSVGIHKLRSKNKTKDRMRWVFKRACLGQSWDELAAAEKQSIDTISKEVGKLAGLLGMRIPGMIEKV
jgi:hypothetical protein